MRICEFLPLLILAAAPPPAATPPLDLVTKQPLDTLEQCFRTQWAATGRLTAINTAAGVMLDLAFDNLGADGKIATSHATFTIEDQGTQRRVSAAAPNGPDDMLANQMLAQAVKRCLPDATPRAAAGLGILIPERSRTPRG